MPSGDLPAQKAEEPAPTADATPADPGQARRRKKISYLKRLPRWCRCTKLKYLTEAAALASAEQAGADLGLPFTVYRCPQAQCWHKATRGFHPRELKTCGRLVAYHVAVRRVIDRGWLAREILAGDPTKSENAVSKAIKELVRLELVVVDEGDKRLLRVGNEAGLTRVIQAGVDGWRSQLPEQN